MPRPHAFTPSNSAIIFYHIYKCAGTSIFKHYLKTFECMHHELYSHHDWASLRRALPDSIDTGKPLFLFGHEAWGVHALLPAHITPYYFTFLREPTSLFLSAWNYKRLKCDDDFASLDDMLHKHPNNIMVHYLGNGSLSSAKKRLADEFALFGLVEHFNASMQMHHQFFGLDISRYAPANVAGSSRPSPDPESLEKIRQFNQLDLKLYEYAERLFMERCSEMGINPSTPASCDTPRPRKAKKENLTPASSKAAEFIEKKDYGQALLAMKALPLDHDFAKTIGKLHAKRGEIEQAREWFGKTHELYPAFYWEYADFLLRHAPEDGLAFLEKELEITEGMPSEPVDSSLNRIRRDILTKIALHCRDDQARAEKMLRTALPDGYGEFTALQRAAVVLRRLGRHDEAVGLMEKFISGNPGSTDLHTAHLEIIATLHDAGKTEQAMEQIRRMHNAPGTLEMPLDADADFIEESLPLEEVVRMHHRLTACSCAPLYLISHFAVCLEQCEAPDEHKTDMLIQRSRLETVGKMDAFNRLIPIPDARFTADTPNDADYEKLKAASYDAAIILCSNLDLADYIEWLKAIRLSGIDRIFLFPRDNVRAGTCLCLKPSATIVEEMLSRDG